MDQLSYRVVRKGEIPVLNALIRHSFAKTTEQAGSLIERFGRKNIRIVHAGHRLAAAACIIPMGHFFGGKSVGATGVAAVCVAPEFRGQGVATMLMRSLVQELAEARVPLSSLYPATHGLYRKVGYGYGGTRTIWEADPAQVGLRTRGLDVVAADSDDLPRLKRIYAANAAVFSGHVDRTEFHWTRILQQPDLETRLWVVMQEDEAVGYIALRVHATTEGHIIEVADMAALTRAAAIRLWAFIADYGTVYRKVRWVGAPFDPFGALLPEERLNVHRRESFFLRILDVEEALVRRGYPRTLDAELHLEVHDNIVSRNNDRFILNVADGKAVVRRGGRAHLRIGIDDLAALYSRALCPMELGVAGNVAATEHALEIATLIFSGSSPWMVDRY